MIITGVLTAFALLASPALPELPPLAGPGVEVSLESPPPEEPKPEEKQEEKPEEKQEEEQQPQPVQEEPQQTPPPVSEVTDLPKTEEPEKEPEPLIDPEGEAAKQREEQEKFEKDAAAFGSCFQRYIRRHPGRLPAGVAKKKLHGRVVMNVVITDGKITAVTVTSSSGTPVLDELARSSALNSGCGLPEKGRAISGTFVGTVVY